MKKDIHPKYNDDITLTCVCGHSIKTGSTMEKIDVEICSHCHPFYTGDDKTIDSAGRVEKFKARASHAKKDKK
jgi:large subunit ribosomal protein L31